MIGELDIEMLHDGLETFSSWPTLYPFPSFQRMKQLLDFFHFLSRFIQHLSPMSTISKFLYAYSYVNDSSDLVEESQGKIALAAGQIAGLCLHHRSRDIPTGRDCTYIHRS